MFSPWINRTSVIIDSLQLELIKIPNCFFTEWVKCIRQRTTGLIHTSKEYSQSSKQYTLTVRSFPILVSLQNAATFIRLNAGREWSCNFPTITKAERRSVSKLTWLLLGLKLWIPCPLWLTVTHLLFSSVFSMTFHFERERIIFAPWGIWTSKGSSLLPVEINVITGLSWISSPLRNPCLVESDVACKANRFEKEWSVVLFLQRAITSTPVFSKNKWPVFCSAGYSNSIFLVPGN